ncbi:MAG: SIR2 family protein [Spirochaetia bacterium]|nr:SIR2 family protein [Spirochaetia bacterium]
MDLMNKYLDEALLQKNKNNIQDFKEIIEKDFSIFIGAGVSNQGLQKWYGCVKNISVDCKIKIREEKNASIKYLKLHIDKLINMNFENYETSLKKHFNKFFPFNRKLIDDILLSKANYIITTNFESDIIDKIEKFGKQHKGIEIFVYPNLFNIFKSHKNTNRPKVMYIHGCISDNEEYKTPTQELVFGFRTFEKAYNESILPIIIKYILTTENTLFYGFNIFEENILKIIETSNIIIQKLIDYNNKYNYKDRQKYISRYYITSMESIIKKIKESDIRLKKKSDIQNRIREEIRRYETLCIKLLLFENFDLADQFIINEFENINLKHKNRSRSLAKENDIPEI